MKTVLASVFGALLVFVMTSATTKQYNPFAAQYYNSSGKVVIPDGYHISVWDDYITPTSAYGNTIDYSTAHFAVTPVITLTGEQNTSSVTNIPIASIATKANNNCTINVITSSQSTVNALGAVVTGLTAASTLSTMKIHVHAVGYTQDQY